MRHTCKLIKLLGYGRGGSADMDPAFDNFPWSLRGAFDNSINPTVWAI